MASDRGPQAVIRKLSSREPVPSSTVTLRVNGRDHTLETQHRWTLLDMLRDRLGLTGSKRGCDRGECGSCTVLMDGLPVYSCQLLTMQARGRSIVTIEGLASKDGLDPVQRAFLEEDGGQCGYCTPGFVMAARALLDGNPNPTDSEIREALAGNLCRCNAYGRIIASVRAAAGR